MNFIMLYLVPVLVGLLLVGIFVKLEELSK